MAKTIMVVDDDPSVLALLNSLLEQQGFDVIQATDCSRALERYRSRAEEIDLVITDLVMPGCDGIELARQITSSNRLLPILFISGFEDEHSETRADWPNSRFLRKPFKLGEFVEIVVSMVRQ
jgi:CheY-like chemotaxis protein